MSDYSARLRAIPNKERATHEPPEKQGWVEALAYALMISDKDHETASG